MIYCNFFFLIGFKFLIRSSLVGTSLVFTIRVEINGPNPSHFLYFSIVRV